MKWKHEFYQENPNTNDKYDFYHSQRRAFAILEVVREIKSNYYEAKVVSIESDENFHVMGQAGGCKHQYKIGDTFTLRHHKNKKGYEWFCDHSDKFWYDPRFKDKDFGERRGDRYMVNGSICICKGKEYFLYTINGKKHRIHVYIMTGGISLQNYRGCNFHIDHINHNPNDNYRDNLEIVTHYSNQYNKESKGYNYYKKPTNTVSFLSTFLNN